MPPTIRLRGATEHNLKEVDLDLEQGQWIAVVGPSGSGKTSLVFDTLVREGQHRYLSSLSTRARHFFGKLGRAATKELTGLPACIAIGQRTLSPNVRSTVGTMTGTLDLLRLLYARVARDPENEALTRSHFSFNHPLGACATCSGIGIEDFVDPATLVADPSKSLRAGALVPTLKNGYTVYSQVTLEVMNTICAAHGFDVDTPWEALDDDQRKVILYGTRALKVPFGKHPIESRMKWEGITARPREEGYYPGLVPIIEETLKRNRNPNILRFVRSVLCSDCGGSRLARAGREARVGQHSLPQLLAVPVDELPLALESLPSSSVLQVLQPELQARLERMRRLDLGHLALDRESTTLSGGEGQRVLLATQLSAGLCGVMFAMDEPTLGLHPGSQAGMRAVLDDLRELGNTLLVVEHDPDMARHADQMVCIGPGPGTDGGEVTSVGALPENPLGPAPQPKRIRRASGSTVALRGAVLHNLQGDDFTLHLGALNLVIGASGAGKSSLIFGTLLPALTGTTGGPFHNIEGVPLNSVRALDARPIGRTSRSTPATWSGLFDLVRKRFAATEQARARKFGPGHFSYNNKSGRCPTCAGIGTTRLGLHVFENVDVVCEDCRGSRYEAGILEVQLNGRSIADILGMTVREALSFFASDPPIASLCCAMEELGLGHVPLGQPSNQLSRGESQRVKLATLLGTTDAKPTLLFLDEPDRGLHPNDVKLLLAAMERLVEAGHTVLAISHHRHLWAAADFVTEVANGRVRANPELDWSPLTENRKPRQPALTPEFIELKGVSTNNLQGIDVRIPRGQLTGICGVSGSGKSSLAYGTLAAEAWQRFSESLPFEVRRHMRRMPRPELESASGLGPTLSLLQGDSFGGTRSSVATQTGLGPVLRLLFSRAGMLDGEPCDLTAEHFSSDRALGACQVCKGRGSVPRCSEARLISDPSLSLLEGAMAGTKPGAYFSERDGQYIATLRTALGPAVDLTLPWQDLPEQARQQALNGSGSKSFKVAWTLAEGSQEESSTHHFEGTWDGFLSLVERESERRANQKSASAWSEPLQDGPCSTCDGSGLGSRSRRVVLGDWTLPGLMQVPLGAVLVALRSLKQGEGLGLRALQRAAIERLLPEVSERLEDLAKLGLGHIPLGRRTSELSGGERQRVRLVSVLRSGLSGVTLVLDEPSAGLQGDEVEALIERLRCLQQANNTIVVVEHDQGFLREMDHLIELGPGAGEQGGTIVA
ncbi:MAG: excinuclease ABC subunit A, partial [Candidatus Paceibacteria bacterium]